MGQPKVTIIIPVFNKWELTEDCLRSIVRNTPQSLYTIIVVDNASSDATAKELPLLGTQLFGSRFQYIRFEENRNFGPASNEGARIATTEFLLFLNNDTLVHPGWLPPLLQAFQEDDTLGAVGPLLLYGDGTIQHMGVTFGAEGVQHLYAGFPADHPVVYRQRELQALTAAALLIRKTLFLRCGGFYEAYRNGFEDVELSLRIRQHGKRLRCIPQSVVTHLESQSPGRFKHEVYNSTLLLQRCENDSYIDIHQHGLLDGFSPVINERGELLMILSDEENARLMREAKNMTIAEVYALTEKNPSWIQGFILIAKNLERQNLFLESLACWLKIINLLPCKKLFYHAICVARRINSPELLTAFKQDLVGHVVYNFSGLKIDFIRRTIKKAEQNKDAYLINLYHTELKRLETLPKNNSKQQDFLFCS